MYVTDVVAQEQKKYSQIWGFEEYRAAHSPGLENVERFLKVIDPPRSIATSIIDIGCGSGKAGIAFGDAGLNPWWLDLTSVGLEPGVNRAHFIESPLWGHWQPRRRPLGWDYGFCCDVMEHIPPEYTMLSVERIVRACRTTWFQISHLPDAFGPELIGQHLHLTVQPFEWWTVRLNTIGNLVDARDICGCGIFVVERQ